MAAPTSTHCVTARKLASTISTLWTKLKNTFAPKTNGTSPGSTKFYREDGTWQNPPSRVNSDWNASSGVAEILNKPMCGSIAVPTAKYLKLSIPRGTQALHASLMMQTNHGATQMLGVLCMNNYISGSTETITGVSICMLRGGKNAGQNIDGVYVEDDGNGYKNFYLYFGDDNAQHNVYWTWTGGTNNISISVVDSAPSTALSMGHSYLPVIAKNIADSSISVGSITQPTYISNNGRIETCGLGTTYNYTGDLTPTKNDFENYENFVNSRATNSNLKIDVSLMVVGKVYKLLSGSKCNYLSLKSSVSCTVFFWGNSTTLTSSYQHVGPSSSNGQGLIMLCRTSTNALVVSGY